EQLAHLVELPQAGVPQVQLAPLARRPGSGAPPAPVGEIHLQLPALLLHPLANSLGPSCRVLRAPPTRSSSASSAGARIAPEVSSTSASNSTSKAASAESSCARGASFRASRSNPRGPTCTSASSACSSE